jgi:hypothetical protein
MAGMNYAEFDIAGYFIGMAFSEKYYHDQFPQLPSKEFQLQWINEYLCHRSLLQGKSQDLVTATDVQLMHEHVQKMVPVYTLVNFLMLLVPWYSVPESKTGQFLKPIYTKYMHLKDEIFH